MSKWLNAKPPFSSPHSSGSQPRALLAEQFLTFCIHGCKNGRLRLQLLYVRAQKEQQPHYNQKTPCITGLRML